VEGIIYEGDCREILSILASDVFVGCITSPPYLGKYDYADGDKDQIGLEDTPGEYVAHLGDIFREVLRVCQPNGVLWLVIGDTFNNYSYVLENHSQRSARQHTGTRRGLVDGYWEKELIGVPFLVKDELRRVGWAWRSCNIWSKPSASIDTPVDRPAITHEYVLQFVKPETGTRRLHPLSLPTGQSVWNFTPAGRGTHPAAFPLELSNHLVALTKDGPIIDPFCGSGTTGISCAKLGRDFVGIEKSPTYAVVARETVRQAYLQPSQDAAVVIQKELDWEGLV